MPPKQACGQTKPPPAVWAVCGVDCTQASKRAAQIATPPSGAMPDLNSHRSPLPLCTLLPGTTRGMVQDSVHCVWQTRDAVVASGHTVHFVGKKSRWEKFELSHEFAFDFELFRNNKWVRNRDRY